MNLLVLGGRVFLGRHVVEAALEEGHEVTTFTRGRTNPGLHPEAEALVGDRDGALDALAGREWDGVVDTSGYVPRIVRQSAELLRAAAGRYVFISSISAYADHSAPYDESAALATVDDPLTEDVAAAYGGLKAACERVVEEVFGDRGTSVRAGLIVGPRSDRPVHLAVRISRAVTSLRPAARRPVNSSTHATWPRGRSARRAGPASPARPGPPTARARHVARPRGSGARADCRFSWVDDATVLAAGVEPWTETRSGRGPRARGA
jgi:2'-hydroxyisoflavone reductase